MFYFGNRHTETSSVAFVGLEPTIVLDVRPTSA